MPTDRDIVDEIDQLVDTQLQRTPSGICECGCGERTSLAKRAYKYLGIAKGQPMRYLPSHSGRARKSQPEVDRFLKFVQKMADGCWLWKGATDPCGYGTFHVGSRRDRSVQTVGAHRFSYEQAYGKIDQELQLDHLCRVRNCVNPDHLEPVTPRINTRRGTGVGAVNIAKMHCPRGHTYDAQNTRHYKRPDGRPMRICRACDRERSSRRAALRVERGPGAA